MSMMSERAETPTTLQRKRVHEAPAMQHNADQEGYDEHDAATGEDQVDDVEDATQAPEVERQTRPRKPVIIFVLYRIL
jgi:FtsZ-interacting cell division protein ZipA